MELDERKIIILKAIIKNYLESGEPVGSRTISKLSGLNLSSATIRNEMSDLEEMGYILQPHTSAGRIPSDKGYRFYVDSLMKEHESRVSKVTDLMIERVDKLEMLLKRLVRVLALDTNYAALISGPAMAENKIRYLQLGVPAEKKLLLILVLEGSVIKNEVLSLEEDLDQETAMGLNVMLNNHLSGRSMADIKPGLISEIMLQAGEHAGTVKVILDSVLEMIEADTEDRDIFVSGAKNIFKYPELSEVDKAEKLIEAFEEKEQLNSLVNSISDLQEEDEERERHEVQVFLGGEGPIKHMKNCSLVTVNYELGEGMKGVIGVIGPKRMDYEKVLNTMKQMKLQLDTAFGREQGEHNGREE